MMWADQVIAIQNGNPKVNFLYMTIVNLLNQAANKIKYASRLTIVNSIFIPTVILYVTNLIIPQKFSTVKNSMLSHLLKIRN